MALLNAGRCLATGLALCNLGQRYFWIRYLALGGSRPYAELLAYIDGDIEWPANEHDAAAHALNEYCNELGLGLPVLYSEEL